MADCAHVNVAPEVVDQTLGVYCIDCKGLLAACWMDRHVPESLWNRACKNDADCVPSKENRDDVCAICHEEIK